MDSKEIVEALQREFPKSALKERVGAGGKKFTYVEGHAAIHRLLDVAPDFNMEYVTHWLYTDQVQQRDGTMKERVTLNMLIYVDIPNLGRRLGHGVAILGGGEDLAKGALTDAFKNALKYAGQGLSLYGEDYEAPPPPPTTRERLSQALKENGIKTAAEMSSAATRRFGKDKLTEEQMEEWIGELSQTKVPF